MASSTWPISLPQYVLEGYTETPQDGSIRSDVDAGPPKIRRRFTAIRTSFECRMVLTSEQVQTLTDFYISTLQMGSLKFDFYHPRTSSFVEMRFMSAPAFTHMAGNLYDVTLSLEKMP